MADFTQPIGLKINFENHWVRKFATIPWDVIEEKYTHLRKAVAFVELGAKLDVTTWSSIALSILVVNVARIVACSLRRFLVMRFSRYDQQDFLLFITQNRCVQSTEVGIKIGVKLKEKTIIMMCVFS